jgi:hypothetical protein
VIESDTPQTEDVASIVRSSLRSEPTFIRRYLTGYCHFVFEVETADGRRIVARLTRPETKPLLEGGVYWSKKLRPIGVPLPRILSVDLSTKNFRFPFIIMEHIDGVDLGLVYPKLSASDKYSIALQLVDIQGRVSRLASVGRFGFAYSYERFAEYTTWLDFLNSIVRRAEQRMDSTSHPGLVYVERVRSKLNNYSAYFRAIKPVPFMDDTTTKNVLIKGDKIVGIVDVDQLCFGDPLLTLGLTRMALLNRSFDLTYAEQWADLLQLDQRQTEIINVYTLMFCLDFMSELGQRFNRNRESRVDGERFRSLASNFGKLADGD